MTRQQQVVIVGGGVIGLLTAYNLASEVRSVVLLDRSNVGQESSWAGGGIVSRCTRGATALPSPRWRIGRRILSTAGRAAVCRYRG